MLYNRKVFSRTVNKKCLVNETRILLRTSETGVKWMMTTSIMIMMMIIIILILYLVDSSNDNWQMLTLNGYLNVSFISGLSMTVFLTAAFDGG